MKRKVIKQGNGTLTITLPKKWTELTGLKGGDDIEIVERGSELAILTKGEKEGSKIKWDITDIKSPTTLRWVLSAMHKSGLDEIDIIYDDPKMLKIIQEEIKNSYVGFAIMEQSNKRIVLKCVSVDLYSELEPSLKRAFQVTLSLGESMLEMMKNKDLRNIRELLSLEKSNNQFTNFCERLLVKRRYEKPEKTCFKYIIVWNLEKVCDSYRDICKLIDEEKITSLPESIIQLYQEVLLFFRSFYNLIYDFDMKRFDKLIQDKEQLSAKFKRYEPKKGYEQKIAFFLAEITDLVTMFAGSTIALNI